MLPIDLKKIKYCNQCSLFIIICQANETWNSRKYAMSRRKYL